MAMKFSPEKYFKNGDKDGDWYKVSIDDTSYYTLLGFKLNDQFSTEDIDGAYRDRYECWEDVRKGRDTGKSLIS